jgi:hypothetical protein
MLQIGIVKEPAPVDLTRISHQVSTAAADPGMSTALRSVARLVSMPVCAA